MKTTALAALMGLGVAGALATPAAARTFVRCDYDGDRCVRVHCDWDGDDCWRQSAYYGRPYYAGGGHWVCYGDGDCRWVYYGRHYYRGYYYGPHVGIGIRF